MLMTRQIKDRVAATTQTGGPGVKVTLKNDVPKKKKGGCCN